MQQSSEACRLSIPGSGAKYSTYYPHLNCVWVTNNKQLLKYNLCLPELWRRYSNVSSRILLRKTKTTNEWIYPNSNSKSISIGTEFDDVDLRFGKKSRIFIHQVANDQTYIQKAFDGVASELAPISENTKSFGDSMSIWNCSEGKMVLTDIHVTADLHSSETAFCLSKDGSHYWTADSVAVENIDVKVGRLRVLGLDGKERMSWLNRDSAIQIRISSFEQIVCGERITIAISGDRTLRVYDSQSIELVKEISLGGQSVPKVAALAFDENLAFVGVQDGRVLRVDLNSGNVLQVVEGEFGCDLLSIADLRRTYLCTIWIGNWVSVIDFP